MPEPLILAAFIAGFLTFFAPCTAPIIPGYLAFISGVSDRELENAARAKSARRRIFLNGASFVVGFSVVFIILGTLVGLAGRALVPYRLWLTRIGGVFVIAFGLFMLKALPIPFLSGPHVIPIPKIFQRGKPENSFLLGATFALGWTPCVGPVLASVLFLASTTTTIVTGTWLLAVFALGLAIPFLATAALTSAAAHFLDQHSGFLHTISFLGGLLLLLIGILLLTNNFNGLVSLGYRLMPFLEYERLLDYL